LKRALTAIALALLFAAAALPLSAMMTLALLPLWRVVEERYGIESVGHSGPSDWCFILVYVLWLLAGAAVFALRARRRKVAT
jgi:MYXO-CTERM domain-containing protein